MVVYDNIVYAGSKEAKNTCLGESGSPLQYESKDHHCKYSISGITAHGSAFCGRSASGHFLAWKWMI